MRSRRPAPRTRARPRRADGLGSSSRSEAPRNRRAAEAVFGDPRVWRRMCAHPGLRDRQLQSHAGWNTGTGIRVLATLPAACREHFTITLPPGATPGNVNASVADEPGLRCDPGDTVCVDCTR